MIVHAIQDAGIQSGLDTTRSNPVLVTGGEASPEERRKAVVGFRRLALLLATTESPEAARGYRRESGRALVDLAQAGDEAGLRDVLSLADADAAPQAAAATTWTVACYQLGDLSPSDLRDFSSPVEAVRLLDHCAVLSHLAAELLVSAPSGLRWTAMIRTGSDVEFQPLSGSTASGSGSDTGSVAAAAASWELRLQDWSRDIEAGLDGVPPLIAAQPVLRPQGPVASAPVPQVVVMPAPSPAPPSVDADVIAALGASLGQVVDIVRVLNDEVSGNDDAINALNARLDVIEGRLVGLDALLQHVAQLAVLGADRGPQQHWWRPRSAMWR